MCKVDWEGEMQKNKQTTTQKVRVIILIYLADILLYAYCVTTKHYTKFWR